MARYSRRKGGRPARLSYEDTPEAVRTHAGPTPLTIGIYVRLQNLVDPHPTKWNRTGIVAEVRQLALPGPGGGKGGGGGGGRGEVAGGGGGGGGGCGRGLGERAGPPQNTWSRVWLWAVSIPVLRWDN